MDSPQDLPSQNLSAQDLSWLHPSQNLASQAKHEALVGTVLAIQANYYSVGLDGNGTGNTALESCPVRQLLCIRRGRLLKLGQQVMVGDRVVVEHPDWQGMRGAIVDVLPRRSELSRPPMANVDQVILLFALAEPMLDPLQLTRFLTTVEAEGLEICLCLNKADLVSQAMQAAWADRLYQWGYQPILLSLHNNQGLDQLYPRLQNKISILAGPSGVGKSSLINQLIPTVNQSTGEVSGKLARGRHTTRHIELFTLPGSGWLADSPGFNRPDMHCLPDNVASLFPEVRQRLAGTQCQFRNCLHQNEPNCAVQTDWERYEHYLLLLTEAMDRHTKLTQQSKAESTTKLKMGHGGKHCQEPKLAAKKYRQTSRKTKHQQLQQFYQDTES